MRKTMETFTDIHTYIHTCIHKYRRTEMYICLHTHAQSSTSMYRYRKRHTKGFMNPARLVGCRLRESPEVRLFAGRTPRSPNMTEPFWALPQEDYLNAGETR